jgi:hypothetical protein
MFWLASPSLQRTSLHVPTVSEVVGLIVERYWSLGALVLLALLGGVALARERSWAILLGLAGLVPGIAASSVLLAFGASSSDRYCRGRPGRGVRLGDRAAAWPGRRPRRRPLAGLVPPPDARWAAAAWSWPASSPS